MVTINSKLEDDGLHVRRVLITYSHKRTRNGIVNYYGTRFITADRYFKSKKATHKYTFKHANYRLEKAENENAELYDKSMYKWRKYHGIVNNEALKPIEFKANGVWPAIYKFATRKELK